MNDGYVRLATAVIKQVTNELIKAYRDDDYLARKVVVKNEKWLKESFWTNLINLDGEYLIKECKRISKEIPSWDETIDEKISKLDELGFSCNDICEMLNVTKHQVYKVVSG